MITFLPYRLFLVILMNVYAARALFLTTCPSKLMWTLRGKDLCGVADNYMCLYDTNERKFRELCRDKPDFHRPGNIFVISGNLQYFAGKTCTADKYQPHKWWTNGSSECQYLKSTCNGEGQIPYDNGTITRDKKCRCDYTNYFSFIGRTRHKCYCDPSEEDCSCYRHICNADQVLTPDYDCITIPEWTGRFVCPEFKPPKIDAIKKFQRKPTICPKTEKDTSGTIQQSSARIAHTATSGGIILCGFLVILCVIRRELLEKRDILEKTYEDFLNEEVMNRRKAQLKFECSTKNMEADIQELKNQLQEGRRQICRPEVTNTSQEYMTDDKKIYIKLMKTYKRIVESIIPEDTIMNMGEGIISNRDKKEIDSMLTKSQKARKLLSVLMNTGPEGYAMFMKALQSDIMLKGLAADIEATPVSDMESIEDFRSVFTDTVPPNIKNLHNAMMAHWIKDSETYIVYTDAIGKLASELSTSDVVTIIGPRGCGKSSALHIVAISLFQADFEIIPCTSPRDMINYIHQFRNQCFIFDDFCGTAPIAFSFIGEWNKNEKIIDIMMQKTDNCIEKKIIFSSDIISFNSVRNHMSKPAIFTRNVMHMLPDGKPFTEETAKDIAKIYEINYDGIYHLSNSFFFYPELCSRYAKLCGTNAMNGQVNDIMSIAYKILDEYLQELTNNDIVLLATFSIFVIYDNLITDKMLSKSLQNTLKDMADFLGSSTGTFSIVSIQKKLDILRRSYITNHTGNYTVINSDMFKGLVSFFNLHHFDFVLEVSPPVSLRTRFQLSECTDAIKLKVPIEKEEAYFNRIFRCIQNDSEDLSVIFKNVQLEHENYRLKFISYLRRNYKLEQSLKYLSKQHLRLHSPLVMLLAGKYLDIFKALVDDGFDIDVLDINHMSPLLMAVRSGNREAVKYLLDKNCDPNYTGGNRSISPLLMAIKHVKGKGDDKIIEMLLKKGSNTELCGLDKKTPLHVSARNGDQHIVELLLKYNANPTQLDLGKNNPLHIASAYNDNEYPDVVKMLLRKMNAADVNAKNSTGKTSIIIAVEMHATQNVKLLLDNGADHTICDSNKNSPSDIAESNGYDDIVKLIREKVISETMIV